MILLEELLIQALSAEGIKASTSESFEWSAGYVLIARTGGLPERFGSDLTGWTGRELVELDLNIYAESQLDALKLGYEVARVCRGLSVSHSAVSGVELSSFYQLPVFDQEYGYTFGLSATVFQN